jgi:hypothetical protein
LLEQFVTDSYESYFALLSLCFESLIEVFAGAIVFDSGQGTHIQHIAQVAIAHFADSFSAPHRTAAGVLTRRKTGKGNQLPVITNLFKTIGGDNEQGHLWLLKCR